MSMTPERLDYFEKCRSSLYINGFLTEAENSKVQQRIVKAAKKDGLNPVIRSIFARPANANS